MSLDALWVAIEQIPVARAIRATGQLFPWIESVHVLAITLVVGSIGIMDLRLLGLGLRNTSVAQLARDAQPWMTGSLIVMILSGVSLYTSEATKCYQSFAFWIKISSLILVMIFTYTVRRKVALDDERHVRPLASKSVALVSVGLWFAVAWGGRWIGFGG